MDSHQLELFALAKDRSKALEQFIPGTEDYYFHACLVNEQAGKLDEIDAILQQWNKRYGETAQFLEIRNRLTLLRYDKKPKQTLDYLHDQLGLDFTHERQVEGRKTDYPTKLDPKVVSRGEVRTAGLQYSNSSDLSGFTDAALEWLADESLDGQRLRNFLARVRRPDLAKLTELVAAELSDRQSSGFGSIAIHNLMLQEQLERLAKMRPDLLQNDAFVNASLVKLQPGPDVDWQNDPKEREAFLDRLWDFVKGLAPKFNPLKAHVLYHRLDLDRRMGVVDPKRLAEYLKLPRQVSYAKSDYLRQFIREERPFSIGQDYRAVTLHPAVANDEDLVRDLLSQIFLNASDTKPYDTWIDVHFLDRVFATTKMLAGAGDMERWFSMINDPAYCQALKDRVEIVWARTNKAWFGAEEPVTLDADVKNVPTLAVKVFEINALNYFLANGRDVDTSIDLDGLVASEEKRVEYGEPPQRRVRRSFDFPTLSKPGVYIVELIGGGISSRALIRKGRLRFVERVGAAGHVFTVLDEDRKPLADASIWLGGREHKPEADGTIVVPFSTHPGRTTFLIRHGNVTTLESFDHQAESYRLFAGLYVDRESLVKKKEARLVVRPTLQLNGTAVALSLLEEPVLVVSSVDRDGVAATQEVRDLPLKGEAETVHVFQVPDKLTSIAFTLRGKVQNLSQGQKVDVSDGTSYPLNGIDTTASIDDLHLARTAAGYVVHHLGKSGEPRPGQPVTFTLQHRDLVRLIELTLQTDDEGRIELGHLRDVLTVSATTPSGVSETWTLPRDRYSPQSVIHVRAGESFRVPLMEVAPLGAAGFLDAAGNKAGRESTVERADASFLERIGATYRADRFSALSRKDGYLEVAGLPAGDYDLWLKRDGIPVTVRVTAGEDRGSWIAGPKRMLERRNPKPLQISGVTANDEEIRIALGNAGERVRVHVFGTRYVPAFAAFDALGRAPVRGARAVELTKGVSSYVSGRDIGDEYRYILERKLAKTFPGNMLSRPGLLLNPWAVRGTETATQEAAAGEAYAASPAPAMSRMAGARPAAPPPPPIAAGQFANLDFLANPAAVLVNLEPDKSGVVTVPRKAVAHANGLRIVAVDPMNAVARDFLLPEVKTAHEDLRLKLALDANQHFSEKKQITVLPGGQPLEIADLTTSKVEVYDTLARVHRLYSSLSNDPTLATFGFAVRWPSLSDDEKRAKYSEFACHELSFFLSKKDPAFFEKVIRPYLRNKLHKTFMDRYLLGDDLSGYRLPWAFGRLNVVERILLGQRIADEADPVARHAKDRNDLLPRDIERMNHLFGSAIQGSALEAGDALGIQAQTMLAQKATLEAMADLAPMTAMGAAAGPRSMPAPGAPPMAKEAAKMKKGAMRESRRDEAKSEEAELSLDDMEGGGGDFDKADVATRGRMRQFYKKLDKTQEWAENNYWHLTLEQMGPELVTVNPFWKDYAAHRKGAFVSTNLAYASRNFTEMMLALSVLDLPFEADKPSVSFDGAKMKLTGKALSVAWHKEIKPVEPAKERVPILVSQNYFRDDDRTRWENDEEVDKYVTGEFLVNVVYTCQVVLTNPTSTNQKLDLLLQIPIGAIPVKNGFVTIGRHLELSSYATESIEYAFYFPGPGSFAHFPVHVTKNEELIASAPPTKLQVVRELSTVDKTSWAWLSQNGDEKDVLRWMEDNNLDRLADSDNDGNVGLQLIAWRMRDKGFYEKAIALLSRRHVYDDVLWAYSVLHRDVPNVRELLQHRDDFLDRCGPWLDSTVVSIDAVKRGRYQHLEYAPLVNARTQKLGPRRKILNDRFAEQYAALMGALRYRAKPDDAERLAVTYYLFLQDRIDEALEMLDSVDPGKIEVTLPWEYLKVYAELFRERPGIAREIADGRKDHPVDRWRNLFRNAIGQIDEISGAAAKVVDEKDREQRQSTLASTEPDFEFTVEKKTVTVNVQNLTSVRVNYYRMDIELLFSRQPFVQQQSGQFSFIKPNRSEEVAIPAGRNTLSFDLPAEYLGSNVIVEVVAAGKRKSQAYYAHELLLQVVESYGQVRVSQQASNKPLPKTYVKVYSRMKGGDVRFFKDGYTDLRGVFDYTSLNTNELDDVDRFSLLILSADKGAVIREAAPPKR